MKTILKPVQRELLNILQLNKSKNFIEISKMMGVSRLTILRHVEKLEKLGYIKIDKERWQRTLVKSITILNQGDMTNEDNS